MTHDASDILNEAQTARQEPYDHVRDVADWFHDREGELFDRYEAARSLADDLDLTETEAHRAIANLLDDHVDPVVQVPVRDERYVGVISYDAHDFWYGYTAYDDVEGDIRKGVCAACVQNAESVTEVSYAAEGHGSTPFGASWDDIEAKLTAHFEQAHAKAPDEVETGADLQSATKIASNTAWHAGNDGSGSGADADMVDGNHAADLAPTYNDGTNNCHIVFQNRFGAEGSSTTATSYTTIAGSDLTIDPSNWADSAGNLYGRFYAHLKHANNSGTAYARMYRQNAATAVSGSAVSVSANDGWGLGDSGWFGFGDSGHESYHVQLQSGDGEAVSYNSVILQLGVPV